MIASPASSARDRTDVAFFFKVHCTQRNLIEAMKRGWGVNVPTTWQPLGVGEILENAVCMLTTGGREY